MDYYATSDVQNFGKIDYSTAALHHCLIIFNGSYRELVYNRYNIRVNFRAS